MIIDYGEYSILQMKIQPDTKRQVTKTFKYRRCSSMSEPLLTRDVSFVQTRIISIPFLTWINISNKILVKRVYVDNVFVLSQKNLLPNHICASSDQSLDQAPLSLVKMETINILEPKENIWNSRDEQTHECSFLS